MKTIYTGWCLLLVLLITSCSTGEKPVSDMELPSFFTDNMVLQQESKVPFFGKATPGSTLTITTSWDFKNYTTKVTQGGAFEVLLHTPTYGGPYEIAIQQGDKITTLQNILIGEVWLCSGQSNMEMPLAGWGEVQNYEQEIADANYPEIRLLQVNHVTAAKPLDTLSVAAGGWQECTSKTIPEFSSTAYFFARKVYETKHIPIGLIHSSWGGTVIEAWTSAEALHKVNDFEREITALTAEGEVLATYQKENEAKLAAWNAAVIKKDEGYKNEHPKWVQNYHTAWQHMELPDYFDSKALYKFDGAVWFQKQINLTKKEKEAGVLLHFFADDDDQVWLNGEFVGATKGYNVERAYQISSEILKEGMNVLTIRVFDSAEGGGIYGDPNDFYLETNQGRKLLGGNWKYHVGVSLEGLPKYPYMPLGQNRPTVLYNAMVHPLLKFPVKGVIWYQGESNADRAAQYRSLFPILINDWRTRFNNPDMPFYFVQLANFRKRKEEPGPSAWAELREAQLLTLMSVRNTGMAVTIDIGEAEDIHPKNKQEVGNRLARIALANVYGEDIVYSGPIVSGIEKYGNTILLSFKFSEGLKTKDGAPLKGFEIAGADKKFYKAAASIKGGKVAVNSPYVHNPKAVRYGWADNPEVNLYNEANLPASPFRTDHWKGITLNSVE